MKKLLLMLCTGVILFTMACKKNEAEVAATVTTSTWTLAGVTYKANITYKTTTSQNDILINFWDATPSQTVKVNSLAISFKEAPNTSGTYQLVGYGTTPAGKQFTLAAGTSAGAAYAYIGPSTVDVAVTVTSGKVKLVIPEITLKGTSGQPDAKLTASVQEM